MIRWRTTLTTHGLISFRILHRKDHTYRTFERTCEGITSVKVFQPILGYVSHGLEGKHVKGFNYCSCMFLFRLWTMEYKWTQRQFETLLIDLCSKCLTSKHKYKWTWSFIQKQVTWKLLMISPLTKSEKSTTWPRIHIRNHRSKFETPSTKKKPNSQNSDTYDGHTKKNTHMTTNSQPKTEHPITNQNLQELLQSETTQNGDGSWLMNGENQLLVTDETVDKTRKTYLI